MKPHIATIYPRDRQVLTALARVGYLEGSAAIRSAPSILWIPGFRHGISRQYQSDFTLFPAAEQSFRFNKGIYLKTLMN